MLVAITLVVGLQVGPVAHELRPLQTRRPVAPPELAPCGHLPLRSVDGLLTQRIAEGTRLSETFEKLTLRVSRHRAIVYVEWRPTIKGGLTGALLDQVNRGPDGTRFLRMFIARRRSPNEVIATIAHEMQHVIEILESSAADIATAYGSRGAHIRQPRGDLRVYETDAAVDTGTTVRRELANAARDRLDGPGADRRSGNFGDSCGASVTR